MHAWSLEGRTTNGHTMFAHWQHVLFCATCKLNTITKCLALIPIWGQFFAGTTAGRGASAAPRRCSRGTTGRCTSPRRSLRMEVAFFARFINVLKKAQLINDFTRRTLLIFLLQISDFLRLYFPHETCLSMFQCEMCDKIDEATNVPFLKSKLSSDVISR